jgi:hypothetical protein
MANQESISLDDIPIELPPYFVQLLDAMKGDRRTLMKDKAFEDAAQLRMFMATTQMVRVEDAVKALAAAMMDIHANTAANAQELQNLHRFTREELNRLGADLEDDGYLPGVSPDLLDDFQQAFFALGSLLQKKLPKDQETQQAFNLCAKFLAEMTKELMYGRSEERADDEGDEGDGVEEADETEGADEAPESGAQPEGDPAAEAKDEGDESDG